jgi:threonyl-tRNA synthetase
MLVVGDREVAEGAVAVRSRSGGDQGSRTIDAFIADAQSEIAGKGQFEDEPEVETVDFS